MEGYFIFPIEYHFNCKECEIHFTVDLYKDDTRQIHCPICGKKMEKSK